jgi:hypothetical protein
MKFQPIISVYKIIFSMIFHCNILALTISLSSNHFLPLNFKFQTTYMENLIFEYLHFSKKMSYFVHTWRLHSYFNLYCTTISTYDFKIIKPLSAEDWNLWKGRNRIKALPKPKQWIYSISG